MAIKPGKTPARPSVILSYQLLRNVTSPDEVNTGVKSFVVNLPAFEILKVGTKENLRTYLAEYSVRKRNRVHESIENTIQTEPERFITRNSGFVIAASDVLIDDNQKTIKLYDASVINGAQSQGEIQRWVSAAYGDEDLGNEESPFHVRAEIIVDSDGEEIVETAIARNTATPVKSISQAGARGHLDDLEKSILRFHPGTKIRKSETDEDVVDTRKILQYARLLMPPSISGNETAAERLRPYKNPEQCLSDFSHWFEERKTNSDSRRKYLFTVQMAPQAMTEYEFWENHSAWNGHHIWDETKKGGRACRRDDNQKIIWISPGIIFPLLGAMSEFVMELEPEVWKIMTPKLFKPKEMIARTVQQFRSVASDPMQMGRSAGVYDALRIYPSTIIEVMQDLKRS